jgi:uncharacterized membrane protein YbhN (UPF0104 family)
MGRMRIKKKETVLGFRETLAYRMILIGVSIVVLIIALYLVISSISTDVTWAVGAAAVALAAAMGLFYNLDRLREAKVPKRTMNRMKRR